MEAPDTEAPSVVSLTPESGDMGVLEDAAIVIEFSEAMDTGATEGAFSSSNLPGTPSFQWSAGNTILNITLSQPLVYAEGATPAVNANEYDYGFSSAATDVAGNALPAFDVSFTTLRRIATTLTGDPDLDGFAQSDGFDDHPYDSDAVAGWYTDRELVLFLTFDTSTLPDNIAQFESSTLYAYQTSVYADRTPYEQFGGLQLQHTTFDNVDSTALAATPLRIIGTFSSTKSEGWRFTDVGAALSEDYAQRVTRQDRSQYWLRFPGGPNGNTEYAVTSFYVTEHDAFPPRIEVIYLLP